MSALELCEIDLEQGRHRRSVTGSDDDTSFSDAEDGSCYSQFYSTTGGSYDDCSFACVSDTEISGGGSGDSRSVSSVSDCSVEVGIENVSPEIIVNLGKVERDCRICHLGLESNSHESGIPIELGCSCKDDLAAAHKHCAETWFKIKGNKTCEICNSVARNVVEVNEIETVEQSNENNSNAGAALAAVSTSAFHTESQSFWRGHRLLNFLLACMVFAFVISWLFHFNVPST